MVDDIRRTPRFVTFRVVFSDCMGGTAARAGSAAGAPGERIIAVGARSRRKFQIGHDRSDPHGDSPLRNQSGGKSERSQPRDKRHVPFRPVRREIHLYNIEPPLQLFQMGCRRMIPLLLQQTAELTADILIGLFSE